MGAGTGGDSNAGADSDQPRMFAARVGLGPGPSGAGFRLNPPRSQVARSVTRLLGIPVHLPCLNAASSQALPGPVIVSMCDMLDEIADRRSGLDARCADLQGRLDRILEAAGNEPGEDDMPF